MGLNTPMSAKRFVLMIWGRAVSEKKKQGELEIQLHISNTCTVYFYVTYVYVTSLVAQMVKRLPTMQETWVLSPGGEGNGNPLQDSCLENPMDQGAW